MAHGQYDRLVVRLRHYLTQHGQCFDSCAQQRHELLLKPGMALEPWLVAWRWVRQRKVLWSIFPPRLDRFSQCRFAARAEKVALCVLTDKQGQLDLRQPGQQLVEPQCCAFTAWRQIAVITSARITIAHGNDCDVRIIVKNVLVYTHPRPQAFPARVVPWNAGCVHANAGCLPHNQDACCVNDTQHRTRAKREIRFARATIAHCSQQRFESGISFFRHNAHFHLQKKQAGVGANKACTILMLSDSIMRFFTYPTQAGCRQSLEAPA
jgi:hypothetical protein